MPNPGVCQAVSSAFPPKPTFTEKDLGDLSGKVFIVTGGYSGIGLELVKVLYPTGATIYIAGRSANSGLKAIDDIKSSNTSVRRPGTLHFLRLDLGDLPTIGASAREFLEKETRLDVLWLNAGVMHPPAGSKTAQGYEMQLGTNILGHFLFLQLLTPILLPTAKSTPVRVVWTTSDAAGQSPKPGGINWKDINYTSGGGEWEIYGQSKAGSIILAKEYAKKYGKDGILSVSMHPGYLKTGLQRYWGGLKSKIASAVLHDPWYGAMTLLWSGLGPEVTPERNGAYIIPWGRFGLIREDVWESDGKKFWDWCEEQVKQYET